MKYNKKISNVLLSVILLAFSGNIQAMDDDLQEAIRRSQDSYQEEQVYQETLEKSHQEALKKSMQDCKPLTIWENSRERNTTTKLAQCDFENICTKFAKLDMERNIEQLPALFQGYECLPQGFCAYYAAYNAIQMLSCSGRSLLGQLNNRENFKSSLEFAINKIKKYRDNNARGNDIDYTTTLPDEIKNCLVPDRLKSRIVVNDCMASENKHLTENIKKLALSGESFAYLINCVDHWIAVLISKDSGKLKFTITDSLARNRTSDKQITWLYNYLNNIYTQELCQHTSACLVSSNKSPKNKLCAYLALGVALTAGITWALYNKFLHN